jgi:nucleoid DNA-binding protein
MPKTTRKTIVAAIAKNTAIGQVKSKEALETVLDSIKRALGQGKQVDLGRLGRLSVVARPLRSRLAQNLKHVGPTIDRLHKKHPKTVRLTKRHDLSENPQPTIVHKNPEPEPVSTRRFAIARPSFRGRPNMPKRRAT